MLNEDWQTGASAVDIIAYYREQMAARGWRDVTEEAYRFQPEFRNLGTGGNSLHDGQYLGLYRSAMESTLIMNRGDWSMQVAAFPCKQEIGQTTVSICAAATPSLGNFFLQMASAVAGNQRQPGQPLDVLQQNGGERYHTTIAIKNEPPAQALEKALAAIGAKGWRPAMFLPKQQTQSGYFVWLVRGKDYAALSVRALPQGKSSSVTLTEVTPEAGQDK